MSDKATISLCDEIEATADLLISQLQRIKQEVHKLRLTGMSMPVLDKGSALTDEQAAKLLIDRNRRIGRKRA